MLCFNYYTTSKGNILKGHVKKLPPNKYKVIKVKLFEYLNKIKDQSRILELILVKLKHCCVVFVFFVRFLATRCFISLCLNIISVKIIHVLI